MQNNIEGRLQNVYASIRSTPYYTFYEEQLLK
jgi:hypothetical protein